MRKTTILGVVALALIAFTAVAYAGPGCSSHKASAETASACQAKAAKHATNISIETTRLPSGSMVVFYKSDDADTVKYLQAKAEGGAGGFSCGVCQQVALNDDCTVELAKFEGGVIAYITSEDAGVVDAYEAEFAALTAPANEAVN